MTEIDKKDVNWPEEPVKNEFLEVSCIDILEVKARVTFDSEMFQGIQVTYWVEDETKLQERLEKTFDLLFDEVLKMIETETNMISEKIAN